MTTYQFDQTRPTSNLNYAKSITDGLMTKKKISQIRHNLNKLAKDRGYKNQILRQNVSYTRHSIGNFKYIGATYSIKGQTSLLDQIIHGYNDIKNLIPSIQHKLNVAIHKVTDDDINIAIQHWQQKHKNHEYQPNQEQFLLSCTPVIGMPSSKDSFTILEDIWKYLLQDPKLRDAIKNNNGIVADKETLNKMLSHENNIHGAMQYMLDKQNKNIELIKQHIQQLLTNRAKLAKILSTNINLNLANSLISQIKIAYQLQVVHSPFYLDKQD